MTSRVLVADSSTTMRKIILRSLASLGVGSAVEAADGQQAADLFRAGAYDLVVTDWQLSTKSGLQLAAEIRTQDPKVPILMVTTESDKARVKEAIQAGVSDYLVKPFTADTLREKFEKHRV